MLLTDATGGQPPQIASCVGVFRDMLATVTKQQQPQEPVPHAWCRR